MPFMTMTFSAGGKRDPQSLSLGLGQTQEILLDWTPALREIAAGYAAYEEKVFATEGRFGLAAWKPLSARYAHWKAARFPGAPINTRTGALRGVAGSTLELTRTKVAVGPSGVPYAGYVDAVRAYVRPNAAQLKIIRETVRRHLIRARQAAKAAR